MSDHRERRDRLHRHVLDVPLDPLAFHQLGVGHALAGGWVAHHPGFDLQPFHRRLQVFAGQLQQDRASLGAGRAQHRTELPDVQGTERTHVPRAAAGIAEDHIHRVVRHVQFFGQQLGERGGRALAQLDLAGKAGDASIRTDPQVGVEIGRITLAHRQACGFLRRYKQEQPGAGQGEEGAPGELVRHSEPPFTSATAASSMASSTRTCEPQRQRLPSICRITSSRVGLGVFWSSA